MFNPGAFYMADFQPETLEYGADAASRYESLADINAIELTCEYTGKGIVRLSIGESSHGPFVFGHDSNGKHGIMLSPDRETLFAKAVGFVHENQCSVNPDPRDPSYFQPSLQPDELTQEINRRFGTSIESPM